MSSVSRDIASWLETVASLGTFGGTGDWALYVSTEPESPDNVVTLYDTGGPGPDTDDLNIFRSTFQVRVRGREYPAAYSRQVAIRDALIHAATFENEVGDARYQAIDMTSDVIPIGRDDNDRYLLTANYRVIREEI